MTKPTGAALYARCSTGHQDVGLQVDELCAVAKQRDWEIVGVYEDSGISGTERSRPALNAHVADCKAGKVDVVVVWKLDRLGRSAVHVCSLAESLAVSGVGLVSVRDANIDSTTLSGRFTLAILSAVAERQRAHIVERVKAGVERARAKGKHLGRRRVALDGRPAVAMKERDYGLKSVAKAPDLHCSTLAAATCRGGCPQGPRRTLVPAAAPRRPDRLPHPRCAAPLPACSAMPSSGFRPKATGNRASPNPTLRA